MSDSTSRNIVIIGGGIIGCTTAYYISRHPSFSPSIRVTILEASRHGAAQGASGKAGGLISKKAYPDELVGVSFREHIQLANEHNGTDRWGWRFVGCGSWAGRGEVIGDDIIDGQASHGKSLKKSLGVTNISASSSKSSSKAKGLPDDLTWVKNDLTDSYRAWTPAGDTAQVHPYLFTISMLELAKERGIQYIGGKATSVEMSDGWTTGVTYIAVANDKHWQKERIPATDVIICAGAWSNTLPDIDIPCSAIRAHSITIRPPAKAIISPYALFTEITFPPSSSSRCGTVVEPEIYARPGNEVYVCGPGDDEPLPETVDDVIVDETACDGIRQHVASISRELRDGKVEKQQACFLPVVAVIKNVPGRKVKAIQGPIIGEARMFAKGLFVATGHTCWGICNAPGTGKALAELVMDGKISCANLKKLDPVEFM